MLIIERLCVERGGTPTVVDLDMELREGTITGLLGPNGAGKTTTIAALLGLIPSTASRLELNGVDWRGDLELRRKQMGYIPQHIALYEGLTVEQNLTIWAGLYRLGGQAKTKAVARSLELANLGERRGDRVKTLSGGMKRRLNLAIGLLNDPTVVICDEPTTGVDSHSRRAIYDALFQLRDAGKHVLYTTHYFQEVEDLCSEVVVLKKGQKVASGPLDALLRSAASTGPTAYTLRTDLPMESVRKACEALGIADDSLAPVPPSLETVYEGWISDSDQGNG